MDAHQDRLCELVDGVLVEKTVGYYESRVAGLLFHFIELFLQRRDLGIVLGADGTLRLMPGLVRIPDVSFISWKKFPNRELPAEPVPDLVPDLAVEVLSTANTAAGRTGAVATASSIVALTRRWRPRPLHRQVRRR